MFKSEYVNFTPHNKAMLKIDLFQVTIPFLSETTASLKMLETVTSAWVHVGHVGVVHVYTEK